MPNEAIELNMQLEALGGLCAGIVGTVVGFPLDLIKTRMQTAGSSFTQLSLVNKPGILQVGIGIVRRGAWDNRDACKIFKFLG